MPCAQAMIYKKNISFWLLSFDMLFEAIVFLVINIHCSKATRKYQFDKRYAKVLMALFAGTLKRRFQKSLQLFEKSKKREKIS